MQKGLFSSKFSSVIGPFSFSSGMKPRRMARTSIIWAHSGVFLMNSSQEGVPKTLLYFIDEPWVLGKYFLSCRGYQQSLFFLICWGDNELRPDISYIFGLLNRSRLFPISPHAILSLWKPAYPKLFSSFSHYEYFTFVFLRKLIPPQ